MKITFLGTGTSQGVPVIGSDHPVGKSTDPKDKRLRTSALISWGNTNINIDCSPDFRQQMLQHNVQHLEAILFTHEHADHTAGLDDIRPFVKMQGDMPIYGLPHVIEELRIRFAYIFATENRYEGAPSVLAHLIDGQPFELYGKEVQPIKVMHGQLPILGYRIENLGYITDAKYITSEELNRLHGLEVLVLNCLRDLAHPTHLNLTEALEIINILKPKRTYLTHISQTFGFHKEVQARLPEGVWLAYDNLVVEC